MLNANTANIKQLFGPESYICIFEERATDLIG